MKKLIEIKKIKKFVDCLFKLMSVLFASKKKMLSDEDCLIFRYRSSNNRPLTSALRFSHETKQEDFI